MSSPIVSTLPLRKKLVAIAKSQVGVREIPKNSNTGPDIIKYQRATTEPGTRWFWCAAFVCWCIREWGKDPEVLAALKMNPAMFEKWRPKTALAYGFDGWGLKNGLLVHDENKNPGGIELHSGDIVTYDESHIGIVDTDKGDEVFTIEGNTSGKGSRDGGGVYDKIRTRKFLRTVIRPLA